MTTAGYVNESSALFCLCSQLSASTRCQQHNFYSRLNFQFYYIIHNNSILYLGEEISLSNGINEFLSEIGGKGEEIFKTVSFANRRDFDLAIFMSAKIVV